MCVNIVYKWLDSKLMVTCIQRNKAVFDDGAQTSLNVEEELNTFTPICIDMLIFFICSNWKTITLQLRIGIQ